MAIATTYTKSQEQLAKNQSAVGSNKPYQGMNGVSQNTANNLGNYQQGYRPSQQAQEADAYLKQIQGMKPQTYNSKYAPQLESILQQITNPEQFKYEFNGDEFFKYFADTYTQKGKQAAMDVMGQAAALTGGYGNSYGQQVAQQGYQQYLMDLYSLGMDFRDRAYQQYQDQLGNKKDAYQLMAQQDATDYSRYRDTVGDWEREREYAAGRADTEREFDYNQYRNDLEYWTGMAQIENAAYNTEADRQEAIRQYNQDFAEKKRQYNTSLAEQQRQYDTTFAENQRQYNANMAENQRQYDTSLAEQQRQYNESLAEQQRKTNLDETYRRDTLAEDIRQYNASLAEQQRQYDTSLTEEQRQYNEKLAEQQRQSALDEAYRRDTLAEDVRQYNANLAENQRQYDTSMAEDIRQYNESLAEQQRQYNANLAEEQRQYNTDEAYRRDTLAEDIRQYNESLAEQQRQYNTNMAEEQRQYDTSMAENIRQYNESLAEQQRQANMDNQYRYDALAQDAEQFNQTTAYNYRKLEQDQAQFDAQLTEQQRQYNMDLAVDYATEILANGQIPSNELLVQAGLSYEDAQRLVKMVTSGGPSKGNEDDYYDPTNKWYVDENGKYYQYTSTNGTKAEKVYLPDSMKAVVKSNDKVLNIYAAGAQRRATNGTKK